MFKRANKITALLVAAASVMSLVPAMAADTTRLGTNEGTIENAVAFKDGKYVYEGYKTNSDNKSVYYNAGDKDKELTDIPDATIDGAYSDKYAAATDGSDEYLVDLTNGSVIDNDTPTDRKDTASTKLKSNVKKTDRYGEDVVVDSSDLTTLAGLRGGDTWYQYGATSTTSDAADYLMKNSTVSSENGKLFGYTNNDGKYIDTSYVANVYAYSSVKDKVVKIDNFSNKANDQDTDTKLQAELLGKPQYLTQDKDNIYQLVNVKITDANATGAYTDTKAKATVTFPTSMNDAAFVGKNATLTVNWANITSTTSAAVVIDGVNYNAKVDAAAVAAATPSATNQYYVAGDMAALKTLVKADTKLANYNYTESANVGTFTKKTAGTDSAITAGSDTNAVTAFKNGSDAQFIVGGHTFVGPKTGITPDYTDIATLKAKVSAQFAAATTTLYGTTFHATYSDGVFTSVETGISNSILFDGDTNTKFVDGTATGTTGAYKTWNVNYIQKLSKAQGDNKDGGLLPKSVASYELSKNFYDCGDGDDAYDAAFTTDGPVTYQVTNGTLFAIRTKADNVKVVTMKLMKDKVKFDASQKPTQHANIDDKVDVYMVEKGDDNDTDVNSATNASSVDVNGNIWALHDGSIKEFVSGKFVEKFTCDRSMDELDVYDENNLVAWDSSGDVYTTNKEGTAKTASESAVVAPVVVTGWVQGTDGSWTFNDATGAKVTNKWVNVGGAWYFLKSDSIMATGWYNDNGTWYFLKSSGAMATGWYNDNGTWYYLNASGAMLANTTVDGYVLGASGAWVK